MKSDCKALKLEKIMTVSNEAVPANFVPAAAVIRKGPVLLVFNGRKVYVDGFVSFCNLFLRILKIVEELLN